MSRKPPIGPKEAGYILSIDQASNAAGVSLWHNGVKEASTTLRSEKATDAIGKRLAGQVRQLEAWLAALGFDGGEKQVKLVIFEGVRARLVLVTVGAFTAARQLQNCRIHARHTFVESTSWKKFAQRRGATGALKDIKGLKALGEIGYPLEGIDSDDEADSVLIYLTWKERP